MFDSVRALNRATVHQYLEVYLRASPELLCKRDQKHLYTRDEVAGDVMGRGLPIETPRNPDLEFALGAVGIEIGKMTDQVVDAILQRGWRRMND